MAAPLDATTCPRCGEVSRGPLAASGVCLRCLGERAFSGMPADELTSGVPTPGLELEPAPTPDRIGGYEIIEELGRGGMGRVYAARQGALGRIVALKVIAAGVGADQDLQLRFLREAQTLARLRHQHIVAVHDYGRGAGQAYLVMDYIEGGDLSKRLRERPLAPREGAELCRKIALALAYTHEMGVLHRDLKPSNILLEGDEPKVADFGLAAELELGGLTAVTRILGTPQYLAPEVLGKGSAASSRAADVYSLGVILFETLTGRTPFAGASPAELPALVASTEPPPPRLLAPAVPRDLETICLKCLEQDPARRYGTAADLAADLGRFLEGRPILARPVSPAGRLVRWCRRRPALATIWLLTALLAAGSTTAAVWIGRERRRTETALRDAKLDEARAVRSLAEPGRRGRAWAALAVAAKIRPGADLRKEALSTLATPDVEQVDAWGTPLDHPVQLSYAADGRSVITSETSADGRRLGTGVWTRRDRPGERQVLETPGARAVTGYRFSQDQSRTMVRTQDNRLWIWRWGRKDPELVLARRMPSPEILVSRMNQDYDFGPDGSWFALGLGDTAGGVTFNRLPDGAELGRFAHPGTFDVLRVSPDGKRLVASDGTNARPPAPPAPHPFYVVDVPSGRVTATVMAPSRASWFEWSSDSRLVVATLDDNTIEVVDARDGRTLQHIRLAVGDAIASAFVGDDRFILTRGSGFSVRVTSLEAPSQQLVIDGIGPSDLIADARSDHFALPFADAHFQGYRVKPPVGLRMLTAPRAKGYPFGFGPSAMDFSPDGRWIATGFQQFTVLRDTERGRLLAEIDSGHLEADDLQGTAFGPDAKALYCGSGIAGLRRYPLTVAADGTVTVGPPQVLDAAKGFGLAARSPDRTKLLLVDQEHEKVKVITVDGGTARTLGAWDYPGIYSGVFGPKGDRVLLNPSGLGPKGASHRLEIRGLDGSLISDLGPRVSCDAAWSDDGRVLLTSAGNQESILWDAATGKPRATLGGELGGNTTSFALAPDGSYAAVQRNRTVHFVNTADGAQLAAMDIPEASGFTQALRFHPDGKRLAVLWNEGRVDLIDVPVLRAELRKIGLDW